MRVSSGSRYFRLLGAAGCVVVAAVVCGSAAPVINISSFEELRRIGVNESYPLSGEYRLVGNIDASGSRSLDGGAGFQPIGRYVLIYQGGGQVPDPDKAFTGSFDGGGYAIRGLYIKRDGSNIGLFGFASEAEIRNVEVVADTVFGYSEVGALVGRMSGGVIEKCVVSGVSGAVIGEAHVGGLAGAIENNGKVRLCRSSVDVAGAVSSVSYIGGLAGSASDRAEIAESYSVGKVSAAGGVAFGGLIGQAGSLLSGGVKVSNCYSMSAVSGGNASSVGGLVGKLENGSEVRQCYSAGKVSGGGAVGGLIGDGAGTASYSFWDTERSVCNVSAGGSMGAVGMTAAQMMSASAVGSLLASDAWGISNNYPYLKNEFFPRYTLTVTASHGGALSGDVAAGGTVHTQVVNQWIVGGAVTANAARLPVSPDRSDSAEIVGSFDGWRLAGSNEKLAAGGQYTGFSVAEASAAGTTGKLLLSELNKDVGIEARFALKEYTLKYVARSGRGIIESKDVNEGERTADTLIKRVTHGAISTVLVVPKSGHSFIEWTGGYSGEKPVTLTRTDTARGDAVFNAFFSADSVRLAYNAGDNGGLLVDGAYVYKHTRKLPYGADGPLIEAVPDPKYHFVKWSDGDTTNPRLDSAATEDITVTAEFDTVRVSVKSPDRVIPNTRLTDETAQIQPVKAIPAGLTAGPNPVSRQNGKVNLYWHGAEIAKGTLRVFDANGNFVSKIIINNINNNAAGKHPIAVWTLTTAKGNPVGAGTYLIKGTLSTKNGKRETVALILSLI